MVSELNKWLENHRQFCDMQVEEIPWKHSKEWIFESHKFRHSSGGFFSIIGVTTSLTDKAQPQVETTAH